MAKFTALNAEVVGISADAPDRNLAWTRELNLPVRLLSDTAGQAGRRYGVWDDLWRIARRATFVVDRQGKVRWMEAGSICVDTSRALQAVTQLKSGTGGAGAPARGPSDRGR